MRRYLIALSGCLFWVGLLLCVHAQDLTLSGAGGAGKVAGGAATTTLDPSHLGTGITLSGGNLTASSPVSATGLNYQPAHSVATHSSGKFYYEVTITTSGGANATCAGLATSSLSTICGFDGNLSGGVFDTSSGFFVNSTSLGATPSIPVTHIMGVATDFTGHLFWVRDTASPTVWNAGGTALPDTGVGGYSISAITCPCYAEVWENTNDARSVVTANFGGSSYAATRPTGFGNW